MQQSAASPFIPFIPLIGPGGLLFGASALSLLAAFLFADGKSLLTRALLPIAAVLAIVPALHTGYFDFHAHGDKRGVGLAENENIIEYTRWDPLAKIEVAPVYGINKETGERYLRFKHVAYDGGTQSSHLYKFDGDLPKLRNELEHDLTGVVKQFWNRSVFAAHRMRADKGSEVLIIGSAAGQETKAALMYNPKSVDAIEMVGAVVELAKGPYSSFIGNIFRDPRVHVQVGEGRTFLRGTTKKYDIIQIFSNHTSSAMAAGGAAGQGTYLHTVESYMEYFSALKPDGMLQINSHIYPRMIATSAVAWKRLGHTDDFRKHVIVFERDGVDTIPLFLVKMTPWTPAEVASLSEFMFRPTVNTREDKYHLSENPLDPKHSFLTDEFYSGTLSPELLAKVPYRLAPPTDDQPYFNFLRKNFNYLKPSRETFTNESTAGWLNSSLGRVGFPKDVGHFFIVGAAGIFFGILFVVVPLMYAPVGRQRWKGEFTSLLYFSCLGAGFIIVELTYIQIFMKLIGYPLYTFSAIIFTMLAAAGLGSFAAEKMGITPTKRSWMPFAGTIGLGLLFQAVHTPLFDHFLAAPIVTRILISAGDDLPELILHGHVHAARHSRHQGQAEGRHSVGLGHERPVHDDGWSRRCDDLDVLGLQHRAPCRLRHLPGRRPRDVAPVQDPRNRRAEGRRVRRFGRGRRRYRDEQLRPDFTGRRRTCRPGDSRPAGGFRPAVQNRQLTGIHRQEAGRRRA